MEILKYSPCEAALKFADGLITSGQLAAAYAAAADRASNQKLTADICHDLLTEAIFDKLLQPTL